MKSLLTEIDISATPEEVWAVLVDLPRYPEWNPFVVDAKGDVAQGAQLRLRMAPPGGRVTNLRPRVTVVEPGRTFEWLGAVGTPAIFSGRHRFELHPTPNGTRLVQGEIFTGVLVRLLARSLDTHTFPGLVALNQALKRRSETAVVAG